MLDQPQDWALLEREAEATMQTLVTQLTVLARRPYIPCSPGAPNPYLHAADGVRRAYYCLHPLAGEAALQHAAQAAWEEDLRRQGVVVTIAPSHED